MATHLSPRTLYRGSKPNVFVGTDEAGDPWVFPAEANGWHMRRPYEGPARGLNQVGARHGAVAGYPWALPPRNENLNVRIPAAKLAVYRAAAKRERKTLTEWVEGHLDAAAARSGHATSSPLSRTPG